MSFYNYPDLDDKFFALGAGKSRQDLLADAKKLGELLSSDEQPVGLGLKAILNLTNNGCEVVFEMPEHLEDRYFDDILSRVKSSAPLFFEAYYRPQFGDNLTVAFHYDTAVYNVPAWLRTMFAEMTAKGEHDYLRTEWQSEVAAQYKALRQWKLDMVATGRAESIDEL